MKKALEDAEKSWNTPEMQQAWERAMQEFQDKRVKEYISVVDNRSGRIDLSLYKHGIWFYIEDNNDCCSVGVTPDEIDHLVERLLDLKQQFLKEKEIST